MRKRGQAAKTIAVWGMLFCTVLTACGIEDTVFGKKRPDIEKERTMSPPTDLSSGGIPGEVTPTVTLSITDAPSVTPPAEIPSVTATPTPVPSPTPLPDPTKPEPVDLTVYRFNEVEYEQPKPGVIRMLYYLREEPGRTAKRGVKLTVGTPVEILYSCTNLFHEPWYRIRTTIGGTEYEGYVQQSTTTVGYKADRSNPEMVLIPVPMAEEPLGTHGPDRNGDGIYVIVLDPGHGGRDPGASGFWTNEKTVNLKVAQYCKAYLEEHYENADVYLTRNGDYVYDTFDTDDDVEYRVRYARDHGADVVMGMHFNAYDGKLSGSMALVGRTPAVGEKERLLATYALSELNQLGIPIQGIFRKESAYTKYLNGTRMDGYLLIRLSSELNIPAIIVEHCYIDSHADRIHWNTEEKLQDIGRADALALAKYLGLTEKPGLEETED